MKASKAWATIRRESNALRFLPDREEEAVGVPDQPPPIPDREEDVVVGLEPGELPRAHEQIGDTIPRVVVVGVKTHPGKFGKVSGKASTKGPGKAARVGRAKAWARSRGKKADGAKA